LLLIREMLEKQKNIIDKIKKYRDKWVAHNDVKRSETPNISAIEIKALFNYNRKNSQHNFW